MSHRRSVRRRVLNALAVVAALALIPITGVTAAHAADPPGVVSNLQTYTHVGAATFSWTLPAVSGTQSPLKKTLVQAKVGTSAPTSPTDGVLTNKADSCDVAEHAVHVCTPNNVTWIDGLDPGTDFTFAFFVVDVDGTVGPAVVAPTLRGADLALSATRTTTTYGTSTTFRAVLRRTTSGAAIDGVPVDFYVRAHGTRPWYFWHESTTNGSGLASTSFAPGLNLDVQAFFYGDGPNLGASSGSMRINVRAKVLASVNFSARKKGKTFAIYGTVASKDPGTYANIERYVRGTWHKVAKVKLTNKRTRKGTTSANVAFKVTPKQKGAYRYRIASPASIKYVTGYSGNVNFRVT